MSANSWRKPGVPVDICELSPAYIRAIAPYQPGKPIAELAREMALDASRIVKLASNENPLGPSPCARRAIEAALADLTRYPDGNAFELKAALARRYGVLPECIVVGNGSNDLLELVAGAFLTQGTASVYSQHAFAVYPLATQSRGARGIVVPAKNYGHDLDGMLAAITPQTRVVFVANPNNPTGTHLPAGEVERFLAQVPSNVVVVLDEAYNEYLPPDLRADSARWVERHGNLVITRTFSKAYGLAGLRVGFGLMAPGVADLLNRLRQPFNVNSLALAAALAALGDQAFVDQAYTLNRAGMAQLEAGFRSLGLDWIPSFGNFISFDIPGTGGGPTAGTVYQKLLRRGVIVRPVGGYEMPRHLRVTTGTAEENRIFLDALKSALDG
jgi:histidinol-phosphate aminotransferase